MAYFLILDSCRAVLVDINGYCLYESKRGSKLSKPIKQQGKGGHKLWCYRVGALFFQLVLPFDLG